MAAFAYALARSKQWDTAVENARIAVRPSTLSAVGPRTMAAVALLASGEPAEALLALQPSIALDPFSTAGPRSALGTVLLLTGRRDEALTELRRAAAHLPDFPPCLRSTVVAAVEAGRMDEARDALTQLRRIDPDWRASLRDFLSIMRERQVVDRFLNAFAACGEPVLDSVSSTDAPAGGGQRG